MSHQVLARKWRPRDFDALVGQEHVVRALRHALDGQRLHHAYLFTGTRGVGKTTLARILAKAVNCTTGIGSSPCGTCAACVEIDAGRFPDCIEMDAASNRGVEEMTQLLENAVYAPTSGRFKVYVIDEVHMLTTHAFNAMLKTLEEPPPHVLFVLATTDPQKVPPTVLSRCLQFNLKTMPPRAVAEHLARVLQAEGVPGEPGALLELGRAARGSMRDALSLADQAIAYSGGALTESGVREMLGSVDRAHLVALLEALAAGDAAAMMAVADAMAALGVPFESALAELAALVNRVALVQAGAPGDSDYDPAVLESLAARFAPEDLQVCYQIAIYGVRDMPHAPDPLAGFTMTLLRLLAFRPDAGAPAGGARVEAERAAPGPRPRPQPQPQPIPPVPPTPPGPPMPPAPPVPPEPPAPPRPPVPPEPPVPPAPPLPPGPDGPGGPTGPDRTARSGRPATPEDWPRVSAALARGGLLREFFRQSELVRWDDDRIELRVPVRPLADAGIVAKAREALARHLGRPVRLEVSVGAIQGPTAQTLDEEARATRQAAAQAAIEADPFVRGLIEEFDASVVPGSVRPEPVAGGAQSTIPHGEPT